MMTFLFGENLAGIVDRRKVIEERYRREHDGAEVLFFDFEDRSDPEYIRAAQSACEPGLFSSFKMVIFLHVGSLSEAPKKQVHAFLKGMTKRNVSEIFFLIIEPGKIKKTDTVFAWLLKNATVEQLDVPTGAELRKHIGLVLSEIDSKASLDRSALEMIAEQCGTDLVRVKTLLTTLASYKPGECITREDILLFLKPEYETSVFAALDALSRGDRKQAVTIFRQVEAAEGDDAIYGLLSMCAWQARRLLQIREAYEQGARTGSDIARATGLPPFAVQNALRSLSSLTLPRLKRAIGLLAEMDRSMKIGELLPGAALDLFIWKF